LFFLELRQIFTNFDNFFFTKTAKTIRLCEVHFLLSTSPNLCQRTTVLDANAPNTYSKLGKNLTKF